jgi:transposase
MSENPEIFVGIDISKDTLDMGFQPSGQTVRLPHDAQGITEATRRLGEAALCLVVLEATGGLETPLAATLMAAGVPVAVVNPRQVRDYAKATGQLAKTDRVDALVLAAFARAIRPELRPMKDALTRELDALVTRRRQLVEMRVQESLRLGRASKVQEKSLKRHIAWLDKRIEEIETDLRQRLRASPAWRAKDDLLRSIPGVGDTTSATLLAKTARVGHPGPQRHRRTRGPCSPAHRQRQTAGQARPRGGGVPMCAVCYTCRPLRLSGAIPSSALSPTA